MRGASRKVASGCKHLRKLRMRPSRLAINGVCQTFIGYRSHTDKPTTETSRQASTSQEHETGR